MNKREYFFTALKAGACKKRAWVNSVFAVVEDEQYPTQPFPYQLVRLPEHDRLMFADPEQDMDWVTIEDSDRETALCAFKEKVTLNPGELANFQGEEPIVTAYGNLLVNYLLLVIPFGDAIPFQNGSVDIGKIEKEILERLIDDPEDDDGVSFAPDGQIYVRQYVQFCDYALSMVAYTSLAVVSSTPKAMQSHPKAREVREALVEQYKDQLTDPAIVAKIADALEELDQEWLADDPTKDFYAVNPKKSRPARKKMYYLFGGESAFQDGTSVEFIKKSLEEGIDPNHLPAMINSIRAASYNRGAQTQLGGETTKTIYRMLGTVRIAEDDCGTKLGIPMPITKRNKHQYLGFWVIDGTRDILLDKENIERYVGKSPLLRGPLTCKTEGKNVCKKCVGTKLSEQPNGIAATAAQVGGAFLTVFLKKMHASSISTHKWDFKQRIG